MCFLVNIMLGKYSTACLLFVVKLNGNNDSTSSSSLTPLNPLLVYFLPLECLPPQRRNFQRNHLRSRNDFFLRCKVCCFNVAMERVESVAVSTHPNGLLCSKFAYMLCMQFVEPIIADKYMWLNVCRYE